MFSLLACVAAAACTGDISGTSPAPDAAVPESPTAPVSSFTRAPAALPDDCALLPKDGACALACNPDALAQQYLPPNTCATFACPLSDGRTKLVGVCH